MTLNWPRLFPCSMTRLDIPRSSDLINDPVDNALTIAGKPFQSFCG